MQRREARRQANKKSFKPSLRLSLQSEQKDCDKTQQDRRSPEAEDGRRGISVTRNQRRRPALAILQTSQI
jgi:hypothetical protein